MPSAIGGLTPEYRGADIRCGLNERLGCGQTRLLQAQRMLMQHLLRSHIDNCLAAQRFSPKQTFERAHWSKSQTDPSLRRVRIGMTRTKRHFAALSHMAAFGSMPKMIFPGPDPAINSRVSVAYN